ncbi:hypothetical protein CWO89_40955 [Bradyrhizobium sp. Leo170]|nr:hypothetical protein CWO90_44870 [Bradyrhizobium sp. Leo121]TAI60388.1 hypothetical protein CWO89_40955 [Bradyrhizobium sp. Leo170]
MEAPPVPPIPETTTRLPVQAFSATTPRTGSSPIDLRFDQASSVFISIVDRVGLRHADDVRNSSDWMPHQVSSVVVDVSRPPTAFSLFVQQFPSRIDLPCCCFH